jgi:dCMP deaminase
MAKRLDYISWNELFMMQAKLVSERSKDPICIVGSVIVSPENKVVGTGYNGFPNGFSDDSGFWGKMSENPLENKFIYVCHAELNAILNCLLPPKGCTMYTTKEPCAECCKAIIQAGIVKVVYANGKCDKDTYVASRYMFEVTGVECIQYSGRTSIDLKL